MGQDCCYSSKDQHSDLRQSRPRKSKDKTLEQNTFKRQLEEPEFVVTRRDSLGMAAKEHTQNMMGGNANQDLALSTGKETETNTNDVYRSLQSEGSDVPNLQIPDETEGTVAIEAEVNVIEVPARPPAESLQSNEHQLSQSLGNMSFGMQNRFTLGKSSPPNGQSLDKDIPNQMNGSMISIRDIQEVRDRIPASPANVPQQEVRETYFQ